MIDLAGSVLIAALWASGQQASQRVETATFSTHCYWTGEATAGRVPGVLRTRIGHLEGMEIVQVEYDPSRTTAEAIERELRRQGTFGARVAPGGGPVGFVASKHSLRTAHPDLYYLDLTELQAVALNTWSYFGGRMPEVLAPDQEQRRKSLQAMLEAGARPDLDPSEARSGRALEAYRTRLIAWLSGD